HDDTIGELHDEPLEDTTNAALLGFAPSAGDDTAAAREPRRADADQRRSPRERLDHVDAGAPEDRRGLADATPDIAAQHTLAEVELDQLDAVALDDARELASALRTDHDRPKALAV